MKGYDKIKEFLDSELSDYSFEFEIEKHDGYTQTKEDEYYDVTVKWTYSDDKSKNLTFHYDVRLDAVEIMLGEDNFHETNTYNWQVKYFWMALLDW